MGGTGVGNLQRTFDPYHSPKVAVDSTMLNLTQRVLRLDLSPTLCDRVATSNSFHFTYALDLQKKPADS